MQKSLFRLLGLSILILFLPHCTTKYPPLNPLFQSPQAVSQEEIIKIQNTLQKETGWRWVLPEGSTLVKTPSTKENVIGCKIKDGQAYDIFFTVKYFYKLPKSLSQEKKERFTLVREEWNNEQIPTYQYHYGAHDAGASNIKSPEEIQKKVLKKKTEKELMRDFSAFSTKPTPRNISVEECAQIIKNKKVMFLTGSGLSLSVGIPTLQKMNSELGISKTKLVDQFVKDALYNPEKVANKIADINKSFILARPTPAHYALTRLALTKNAQIITGNIDFLHEMSGIKPYKVEKKPVEVDWNPEVIKGIEAIICIGTSYDFDAILGKYKKFNSNGIIIAINKEQPLYLNEDDLFLQGDIQAILPNF